MSPVDAFVEDFVGADRALKRLALQRVGDIDLLPAAAGMNGHGFSIATRSTLRTALALLLQHGVEEGVVVDEDGEVTGVLSVELLSKLLEHEAEA